MTEVAQASSFKEWSGLVPHVGREGLVGVYLEVDHIDPSEADGIFKMGALVVAEDDGLVLPGNTSFKRPVLSYKGLQMTGAHVDCTENDSLPPRTYWAHKSGQTLWRLVDTGSSDLDKINDAFDIYTVEVSKTVAKHAQIFRPEVIASSDCVSITFTAPAIFCGASGSNRQRGLNAAIHQVIPGPQGRQDYALNSLVFADTKKSLLAR